MTTSKNFKTSLDIQFRDIMIEYAAATNQAGKKKGLMLDRAQAVGYDFIVPSKGGKASKEEWAEIIELTKLTFSKEVQTLLKLGAEKAKGKTVADSTGCHYTPTGTPKDFRYWNQQIGSRLSSWAKALENRKIRAAQSNGASSKRTLDTRVIEDAGKLYKAVVTCDPDSIPEKGFDLEAVLNGLAVVIKAAGGKLPKFEEK